VNTEKTTENTNAIDAAPKADTTGSGKTQKATVARQRVAEKIRSELNIEKWPAIWQPAKSKNKPSLRVMEREVTLDGNRIISRVEVGYTHLGTLTTEEQKMLYVLIHLWEHSGKPDTQVFFSSRGLARLLKKKGWGTNVIQALTKSLRKLRTIPIEWINSYYDQTKQGAVVVDRRPFSLLAELRIVERQQDGAVNSSQGYFKFDDHVLSNLLLNYTKPVCIEEFFKLKSEIAQLIYSHVDLMLFDKSKYERRSRELFNDLGLKNLEYNHMYERKRAIDRAIKELSGIRLSSGVLRTATVEKTVDGKDYKVSFSKTAAAHSELKLPESVPADVVINHYSKAKHPLTIQAEKLVRYFYEVFHDVDSHAPQSKETAQALSLVSQHGFESAKHVVDFTHAEAAKTNYAPQHFGAVLSYASRAMAELERTAAVTIPKQPRLAAQSSQPEAGPEQRWVRGECRLAMLTGEQYEVRYQRSKAEVVQQQPFLAAKNGSFILTEMIRSRIVRQLDKEPMDLLIVDGVTDPDAVRRKLGVQNSAL
jgi:hypothetical protein